MQTTHPLEEIKKLKAIADVGLLYSANEYDKERYSELLEIAYRLLNTVSGHTIEELKKAFPPATDYPTAKVDIRALVLSPDKQILMVKESADGKWSLPGGWADVGYSPAETVVKEVKEETGLDISAAKLLAVFDKRKHNHPAGPLYVYKLVFYCEAISSVFSKGFDVLDVGYFPIDALPPLSEERIVEAQIQLVYNKILTGDSKAYFD